MVKHWNHGVPKKGEATAPKRHPLEVRRSGRLWHATWELEGVQLHVCSAYGDARAPLGKDPDAQAEALFKGVLDRAAHPVDIPAVSDKG